MFILIFSDLLEGNASSHLMLSKLFVMQILDLLNCTITLSFTSILHIHPLDKLLEQGDRLILFRIFYFSNHCIVLFIFSLLQNFGNFLSTVWAFIFCIRPLLNALKAEHMVTAINPGLIFSINVGNTNGTKLWIGLHKS